MPNMNQHTITKKYKNEGGEITVTTQIVEGDLSKNFEKVIPAGAVNAQINIDIPITTLLACAFGMTRAPGQATGGTPGPLALKTNSTSTPGNTLVVTLTNGICWASGDDPTNNPNPLTTAVTVIYASNPGDRDAVLSIRALNDSTPGLVG